MKNKKILQHILIAAVPLIFLSQGATAQHYAGYFDQADKLFAKGDYYEAAQVYEKYLATEKNARPKSQPFAVNKKRRGASHLDPHEEATYRLGESYRLINDYQRAEKYYQQAMSFSPKSFPAAAYWYGVSLRANGKYADANRVLSGFVEKHQQLDALTLGADRELEDLKFIQTQAENQSKRFSVTAYADSGKRSAYALTLKNNDSVAFTMVRETSDHSGQPEYRTALFEAEPGEDPISHAAAVSFSGKAEDNEGMASYSRDGKHLFFTRWTKTDGRTRSAIYTSTLSDTGWSAPVRASDALNAPGTNNAQPSLLADSRYLIFSSDRPGGIGGYDLWYALLDSNLEVVLVKNLGNVINSPGDEEAPYFHDKSRTLVFSSNGRVGMGGFDLFYSRGNNSLSGWEKPENPGAPLNSEKDDLYYVSTDDENLWNTGWLSSDRSSGCCLALFKVKENNARYIHGTVTDCKTGKPMDHTLLTVTDTRHPGRPLAKLQSDEGGRYAFELHNTGHFRISAEREGYGQKTADYHLQEISGKDSISNGPICLEKLVDPAVALQGLLHRLTRSSRVGNFGYKKAVLSDSAHDNLDSLALLMKNNPQLVIQVEGYTDGIGGKAYNIRLAQKRVDVCIQYLVRQGVPADRLVGKAMGSCCAIMPETINGKDNPAGRAVNRRVEYKVLKGL